MAFQIPKAQKITPNIDLLIAASSTHRIDDFMALWVGFLR
jgi:undecaprenyl pyrophosphate synthase